MSAGGDGAPVPEATGAVKPPYMDPEKKNKKSPMMDNIAVRLLGEDGKLGDVQRVTRHNLTVQKVNKIFDCNAEYMKDQFGFVTWPGQWITTLKPRTKRDPWEYTIVQKPEKNMEDSLVDRFYEGTHGVYVENVPNEVTVTDLEAWIRFGLMANHPGVKAKEEALKKTEHQLEVCKYKIQNLPFVPVPGTPEEQFQRRTVLKETLEKNLEMCGERIEKAKHQLKKYRKYIEVQKIILEKCTIQDEEDTKRERSDWTLRFTGQDKDELEHLVVFKHDWRSVRLAKSTAERPLPYCTTLDKREIPEEYQEDLVNMREARVMRSKNGHGKQLYTKIAETDEKRKMIIAEETAFYDEGEDMTDGVEDVFDVCAYFEGEWLKGQRTGKGSLFLENEKYDGGLFKGERVNEGTITYSNGDTYVGEFGTDQTAKSLLPGAFDFILGLPHGKGEYTFLDGSSYVGEMREGVFCGKGMYVDATGYVQEGMFEAGVLHGFGTHTWRNGHTITGNWIHGVLHGPGVKEVSKHGDEFKGTYIGGEREGRATIKAHDGDLHANFWTNNLRSGHGSCKYGNVAIKLDSNKKPIITSDYEYEGHFLANKTCARGLHTTFASLDQEDTVALFGKRNFTISRKPAFHQTHLVDTIAKETKKAIQFKRFQGKKAAEATEIRRKRSKHNRKAYKKLFFEVLENWALEREDEQELAQLDDETREAVLEERAILKAHADKKLRNRLARSGKPPPKTAIEQLREFTGEGLSGPTK
jgi:hypothetical protein